MDCIPAPQDRIFTVLVSCELIAPLDKGPQYGVGVALVSPAGEANPAVSVEADALPALEVVAIDIKEAADQGAVGLLLDVDPAAQVHGTHRGLAVLVRLLDVLIQQHDQGEDVALGHIVIAETLAGEVVPGLVVGADGEDPRLSHVCSHLCVLLSVLFTVVLLLVNY